MGFTSPSSLLRLGSPAGPPPAGVPWEGPRGEGELGALPLDSQAILIAAESQRAQRAERSGARLLPRLLALQIS